MDKTKNDHSHNIGDGPIEQRYRDVMQALAHGIDDVLNGPEPRTEPKKTGFVLMVFPFGEEFDGRCNYIASAKREDVVVLLKEQLKRFEGAPDQKGTA
jgi:hypothetical protein